MKVMYNITYLSNLKLICILKWQFYLIVSLIKQKVLQLSLPTDWHIQNFIITNLYIHKFIFTYVLCVLCLWKGKKKTNSKIFISNFQILYLETSLTHLSNIFTNSIPFTYVTNNHKLLKNLYICFYKIYW